MSWTDFTMMLFSDWDVKLFNDPNNLELWDLEKMLSELAVLKHSM